MPEARTAKVLRLRSSARPRLISDLCALEVLSRGGKGARQMAMELAHVLLDSGLIAFDGEEVIAAFFLHDNARGFALSVERIGRDEAALQLDAAEHGLDGGNFVGALGHRFRTEPSVLRH